MNKTNEFAVLSQWSPQEEREGVLEKIQHNKLRCCESRRFMSSVS